jgi:hypothetical protein
VEKLNIARITWDVIDFDEDPEWKKSDKILMNEIEKKVENNKFQRK